ncbi:hypothetical protein KC19_1G033700 [Ceratodon purpureus]|uniref:Uncharacterized protein n=1 Tax=Ceratodon purpureus TaxID=3225 RepID=A0A8T0J408_CERPU|nr:hypothetical protein KC19_1G033700 [Ceratodon purpureus]
MWNEFRYSFPRQDSFRSSVDGDHRSALLLARDKVVLIRVRYCPPRKSPWRCRGEGNSAHTRHSWPRPRRCYTLLRCPCCGRNPCSWSGTDTCAFQTHTLRLHCWFGSRRQHRKLWHRFSGDFPALGFPDEGLYFTSLQ